MLQSGETMWDKQIETKSFDSQHFEELENIFLYCHSFLLNLKKKKVLGEIIHITYFDIAKFYQLPATLEKEKKF